MKRLIAFLGCIFASLALHAQTYSPQTLPPYFPPSTFACNAQGTTALPQLCTALNQIPTSITGSTQCLQVNSSGVISGTGALCGGAGSSGANPSATIGLSAVNGVATTFLRSDGAPPLSQAITPTWTGLHTYTNSKWAMLGSSTGTTTLTSANAGASNFTLTLPALTDTLAVLGTAQTWTAVQTFTNSDLALLGSSTGKTTFTSANAGASNFTLTVPAVTDTLATLGTFAAPPALGSTTPAAVTGTTVTANTKYVHGVTTLCNVSSASPTNHTGDSVETNLVNCTVPAAAMGSQGVIRATAVWNRSAATTNTVTYTIRFSTTQGDTSGGGLMLNNGNSTSGNVTIPSESFVRNTATNAQLYACVGSVTFAACSNAVTTTALDTTGNTTYVNFNCKDTTATTDTCGIYSYIVELIEP